MATYKKTYGSSESMHSIPHTSLNPTMTLQVPWLIVFGAVTLIPQTVVCFYMFLAAYVGCPAVVALDAPLMLPDDSLSLQDLKPFDQALQMVMVICIFLEFALTIRTVSLATSTLGMQTHSMPGHIAALMCAVPQRQPTLSNQACLLLGTSIAPSFRLHTAVVSVLHQPTRKDVHVCMAWHGLDMTGCESIRMLEGVHETLSVLV